MPSTYSDLLRLLKQATGENSLTWGDLVNSGFLELLEDSVAGTATIDLTAGVGGYTTVSGNGVSDESRCAILKFTGAPTVDKAITVPTTSKIYIVQSALSTARTLTITTGAGTTTTITQGQVDIVMVTSAGVVSIVGDSLKKSNNLSDLVNAATARINLGLGTVATLASDTDGTLAANSDARVATQKAVKTYVDPTIALAATAIQPATLTSTLSTQFAGCSLYQTTGTVLTINTWVTILFDTELYDDSNWHSIVTNTGRITADFTGRINLIGTVDYGSVGASAAYGLRLLKNGVVFRNGDTNNGTAGLGLMVRQIIADVDCVPTDYFEFQAFTNNASPTTTTGLAGTSFTAKRIR